MVKWKTIKVANEEVMKVHSEGKAQNSDHHILRHADFLQCVSYHSPLVLWGRHLQFLIYKRCDGLCKANGCYFDANTEDIV